ncbi:hypothetical protein [Paraburkholderia sp. J41]|uniref:hypothetical protein n=1 Tax=Paraburkholderia sp. J41 TaxID=2805433 RepID=UPI002AC35946|nr:hypothetical protein [Paraburkholderia sp. J41]
MDTEDRVTTGASLGEALSVADAAKLLFVSRPHVLKLLEKGKLELRHETASEQLVTRASVQRYQAEREAAARAYQDSASNEE